MPGLKTYSPDMKHIYSVDMMLSYINVHKPKVVNLPVDLFVEQLNQNVWGDWSPMTVIHKITMKKYKANADRIYKADLSYPIIITDKNNIVDGYHRAAKAVLEGKKTIKAYVFNNTLMNKFLLDKDANFVKVHQHTSVSDILDIYISRFC